MMKNGRIIAIILIFVLIFGGCAPKEVDDSIEMNTNVTVSQTQSQSEQSEQQPQVKPNDIVETPEEESGSGDGAQNETETPAPENNETTNEPTPEQSETSEEPQQEQSEQPENEPEEKLPGVVDLATDVRFFGRTYEQAGTYYFNWTESGFEFNFNGTGAEATFESDRSEGKHTAYIRIYIDGAATGKTYPITETMQTITLCSGLKKGSHTVRVVKRTNARSSSLGVTEINLLRNGVVEAPPVAKTRRIEFIGDSLTVGYGTQGTASTAEWSTATEDGSVTYAALTGKALDAEYNVIAVSGRGLAHNTGGDTDKLMPALYTKLDEYNNPDVDWDFSSFVPDVVVIHLGNNDHNTSTDAEVTAAMAAFLKTVRKNNKNAHIVVAYGLCGNKKEVAIKSAVMNANDNKITYFQMPNATEKVLGHPAKSAHQAGAKALEAEIRRLTGWK